MKCHCVADLEKRVLARVIENVTFKKTAKRVTMRGVVFVVRDNEMTLATANVMEIELEGQKKLETMNMVHSFCPFCGTRIGDEPK